MKVASAGDSLRGRTTPAVEWPWMAERPWRLRKQEAAMRLWTTAAATDAAVSTGRLSEVGTGRSEADGNPVEVSIADESLLVLNNPDWCSMTSCATNADEEVRRARGRVHVVDAGARLSSS